MGTMTTGIDMGLRGKTRVPGGNTLVLETTIGLDMGDTAAGEGAGQRQCSLGQWIFRCEDTEDSQTRVTSENSTAT